LKFDKNFTKERTHGMVYSIVSVPISGWWGWSHELQERRKLQSQQGQLQKWHKYSFGYA